MFVHISPCTVYCTYCSVFPYSGTREDHQSCWGQHWRTGQGDRETPGAH